MRKDLAIVSFFQSPHTPGNSGNFARTPHPHTSIGGKTISLGEYQLMAWQTELDTRLVRANAEIKYNKTAKHKYTRIC